MLNFFFSYPIGCCKLDFAYNLIEFPQRGATYIYSCMDVSNGTVFISTPCLADIAEDMPAIDVFEQMTHI